MYTSNTLPQGIWAEGRDRKRRWPTTESWGAQ